MGVEFELVLTANSALDSHFLDGEHVVVFVVQHTLLKSVNEWLDDDVIAVHRLRQLRKVCDKRNHTRTSEPTAASCLLFDIGTHCG